MEKVTFTITTCRRFDLFCTTMNSFLSQCEDIDKISRWLLVDDGSSVEDVENMLKMFPFFEFYRTPLNGQASSINRLLNLVKTEWFFHCEDDWLFVKKDMYISKLLNIAKKDDRIRNITLRDWDIFEEEKNLKSEYSIHKYVSQCADKEIVAATNCRWYGYTFNPSLHHLPTAKLLGSYNESHPLECRRWDREPAKRYMLLGYKVAVMNTKYIEHIGEGRSLYDD